MIFEKTDKGFFQKTGSSSLNPSPLPWGEKCPYFSRGGKNTNKSSENSVGKRNINSCDKRYRSKFYSPQKETLGLL